MTVLVDPFTRNSAAFAGAKIRQPSIFLAGATDGLNLAAPPSPESMSSNPTDLRSFVMLEGVGHWPQLETSDATNAAFREALSLIFPRIQEAFPPVTHASLVAFLQSLKGHRHD